MNTLPNRFLSVAPRGFAFAEALVMIMFVGTLMMPMLGSLTNNAGRTNDLRHKRMAEAQAQSVQAQLLAKAPYRETPAIGAIADVSLDEMSSLTTQLTFTPVKGLNEWSIPPMLLATPTYYYYRIDVDRVSTDPTLDSPANMACITGVLAAKPINLKDPPIFVCDKVNFKILIVTIDDSSGTPVGTVGDEIPFTRGANCGALSGDAASTNYIEHCPGEMAVHPSGKWLFGAGSQFAWVIDVDPASPYYKQEIWHRDPEANADGTNVDELLGAGGAQGSYMALSPCGKYFHVMTNCNCVYHYKFDITTTPPTVTFLYKNHDADGAFGANDNQGIAYSRTGILAATRQNSNADNTWFGDPRYIFAGARPAGPTPFRWQKLGAVDLGHMDGSGFAISHDGRHVYRHPDGCDAGVGGYKNSLITYRNVSKLSTTVSSDNWGRIALSADGRLAAVSRYEGTNPSFSWYDTTPQPLMLNSVDQTATAKESGWITTSGNGKYFVLLKPQETGNNDEIQFLDIASLTTGAPPFNVAAPDPPKLSLGSRDFSGATSRWVERLMVGCSDAGVHKALVLDMGTQKLYKEISLDGRPDHAAADPTGCYAILASDTSSHKVLCTVNTILATAGPMLPDGSVNSVKGGNWAAVTASNGVTLRHFLTGHAVYDVLRAPIGNDFLGLLACEGTFLDAAIRPIYTATPTIVNGLTGTYFDNLNLDSNIAAKRTDGPVHFDFGSPSYGGAPFTADDIDGVRWTGRLRITADAGTYGFWIYNDDGVRFWIDDTLVVNRWTGDSNSQDWSSGSYNLALNRDYKVTLEFYRKNAGTAECYLQWDPPSTVQADIPAANLRSADSAQPAVFSVLDVKDAQHPGGIAYFNGSDTHVFPYFPYAFDFPASPGVQVAITPDDGLMAVMVPNVGAAANGRRIDLYDINHDISAARFGLQKWEFNHSAVNPTFRRGTPTGTPTTIKTSPIKDSVINTGCLGCVSNNCANEFWNDALNHTSDPGFGNKTWHFFGKVFYLAPTIYSLEWRTSVDDGALISIDESTPVSDWSIHPFTSVIGTETFAVPTAAADSQRAVRLRKFSMECYDGGGCAGIWADYMEVKAGNQWGYAAAANVGNTYFPSPADNVQKFFHGYNPPRFIRSIPMKFGAVVPWGTGSGFASDAMVLRMNPNGESLVVLDKVGGHIGEFNLYDNGSWTTTLPTGWSSESDVALSPDGERIYVSLPTAKQIVTYENSHYLPTANNHTTIATISLSLTPISLAQGEGRDRIQHGRVAVVSGPAWTNRRLVDGGTYRDRLYSFGGTTDGTNGLTTVQYLNTLTGAVVNQTAFAGQRMSHNVVLFDNKFWILGGWHSSNNLNSVEIFDPETNSCTAGPPMTMYRAMGGAATDGDAIYYFGGLGGTTPGSSGYQNDLEMYTAGRWVPVPTIGAPTGRMHTLMLYYNKALWLIGGCTSFAVPTCITTVNKLDLTTLTWTASTALPAPRGYHKGVVVGNRAIIYGGRSGATFYDTILSLNLDNPSEGWVTIGTMPTPRAGQALGTIGGRVYCSQGYNSGGLESSTEYLTP